MMMLRGFKGPFELQISMMTLPKIFLNCRNDIT